MSTNVVEISRFRNRDAVVTPEVSGTMEAPDIGDDTINKFFKMCDYLRSLGEDNTAVIRIGVDRLEIEAEHFRELKDGSDEGSVVHTSKLCLNSSMDFPEVGVHSPDDLREIVDNLILD